MEFCEFGCPKTTTGNEHWQVSLWKNVDLAFISLRVGPTVRRGTAHSGTQSFWCVVECARYYCRGRAANVYSSEALDSRQGISIHHVSWRAKYHDHKFCVLSQASSRNCEILNSRNLKSQRKKLSNSGSLKSEGKQVLNSEILELEGKDACHTRTHTRTNTHTHTRTHANTRTHTLSLFDLSFHMSTHAQ